MNQKLMLLFISVVVTACVSTQSTLQNVDESAPVPKLDKDKNAFVLSGNSQDIKYGFDADYPINVFYQNTAQIELNQKRYLNALAGPKGEVISYKKVDQCCPFPTKRTEMGAGSLDVYEITWPGQKTPLKLYLNGYEKGALLVPMGLTLKKE